MRSSAEGAKLLSPVREHWVEISGKDKPRRGGIKPGEQMKYMRRRGLRMFAVAALVPMMALAQNNAKANKPAAGAQDATIQQVTQLVRNFLANVPKNDPKVFQEF